MVDPSNVKVLVACEESQAVCTAFRKRGFDAWSCDIVECSGGHPEWHFQQDCTPIVNSGKWDLVIAHPPCTYLCNSGNRHFNVETYGEKAVERMRRRDAGADFFMMFTRIPCDHWAIENPIGCMSTRFRKPDQVIQPYQFGHPTRKSTCLWLKGLPKLVPTNVVEPVTYTYVAKDVGANQEQDLRRHRGGDGRPVGKTHSGGEERWGRQPWRGLRRLAPYADRIRCRSPGTTWFRSRSPIRGRRRTSHPTYSWCAGRVMTESMRSSRMRN